MVKVLGDLTGLGKKRGRCEHEDDGQRGAHARCVLWRARAAQQLGRARPVRLCACDSRSVDTADERARCGHGHDDDGRRWCSRWARARAVSSGLEGRCRASAAQAAIKATGHSYDDYAEKIEHTIKSQEKYGHTADETQSAPRS